MAADSLPDFHELALELIQLRHRQQDMLRQHDKALERIAAFPNEFGRAQASAIAAAIEEIADRIEAVEAQLIPLCHDE
jgi:hypothetical protein